MHLEETGEPEKRILVVEVSEAPSRELSMEAGWGSYELLRLGFGFRDKNFRGTGRTIRTDVLYSLKGERVEVGITDPWFLGTDIVANLPLYYSRREEPSFTRQDTGGSFLFSKRLTSSLTATLGYSLRWTETKDIEIVAPAATVGEDNAYNIASIKAQATWDTRNDILFPSAGYRNFLAAEVADRVIGSEINLVRFSAGSRYFRPLTKKMIFGIRYSTGLALPVRNQVTIPLAERFFNGGENTVRSFEESMLGPLDVAGNPVGGMAFNVINVELRRRITSKIVLSLFTDFGNVSPNRSTAEKGEPPYTDRSQLVETTFKEYFQDFRSAVGIGMQYLLPVGPVRLDFAINPDPRQERYEERYNFHFSVGMAF
jgi:outer membrane protein assembly factor BamA